MYNSQRKINPLPKERIDCLFVTPGVLGQEHQNGENFQTAGQHIEAENQLAQGAVGAEITGGTHLFQTGAHVVETGQNSCEIGADGIVIQRNNYQADKNDDDISGKVSVGVGQNLFIHHITVVADHHDFSGA